MIHVENLVKTYRSKNGTVIGVDNVSVTIKKGEVFGIVGYSGAGKSSFIRCLNLLEKPTSGEVYIDDVPLTKLSRGQLRKERLKIGMIFQHFYLISAKTVAQNIEFSLKAAGIPRSKRRERVQQLLEMVELSEKADVYPAQLSGGQKQRVGIARALANDPSVLLCDEATSALDPRTTKSILALLKKINRELGITIVLITHEMEVVKEICDRVAVMQDGKFIEEGQVYDVFAHPEEELTKHFISNVLQFELPEEVLRSCEGEIVRVQFKGAAAKQSVISDMIQQHQVSGNFLHGKIEYIQGIPLGIFIMELTGKPDDVQRAITYLQERIEQVEVVKNIA